MNTTDSKQPETVNEAPAQGALAAPTGSESPSDFLKLGFPNFSIFGETWHEMSAVTYLEALVAEGDKWQTLTPEQVATAMKKVKNPRERGALGSILRNHDRLRAVAERLTSSEDAMNFSCKWRRMPNDELTERREKP